MADDQIGQAGKKAGETGGFETHHSCLCVRSTFQLEIPGRNRFGEQRTLGQCIGH